MGPTTDHRAGARRRWTVAQRWFLLAACLVVVSSLLPAPGAARADTFAAERPGGIGVRLLDAPSASADDPRAQLYIIDHLAPGSVIERRIEVTNTTSAPATIRMYAAGASIDDGTFAGGAGDAPNELSAWNAVHPDTLELDAGGHATVTVTITVPDDAAPGERYAAVWAEVRSGTASLAGVEQVNRVGIRQYLSVGPGGPPPSDFTIDSLTASRSSTGAPLVLASVRNTGGRALDMGGELELLDGPGGLRAGPFPASLGSSLSIGGTGQVAIPLDEQIPDGPWQATITLRSGLLERSAQATLTFPDSGSATSVPVVPVDEGSTFFVVAALLVALLGVAIAWIVLRRHRNPTERTLVNAGAQVGPSVP